VNDTDEQRSTRMVCWVGAQPERVDAAVVRLGADRLDAHGSSTTDGWVLAYRLHTGPGWVTRSLDVIVDRTGSTRTLRLGRDDAGRWSARRQTDAGGHRTAVTLDLPDLDGALDCDLGLCPLTNSMPVLRERLLDAARLGEPREVVLRMAWISVPDLDVSVSEQHYASGPPVDGGGAVVRFAAGAFVSHIEVDDDGLVVNYPGIGRRLWP
jgi:hypothetical protein